MDEQELIRRSQAGDAESFSELITPYEEKMFHYAYRMLQDEQDAQDAAQEAFLRAWTHLSGFGGKSSFSTWLYTILNRICLDILRKKKRRGEQTQVSIYQSNAEDEYEIQIEDTAPGPYENTQKKAAQEMFYKALNELSEEHRQVIVLRDIEGFDYDKIADITDTSLGTVKSRLSRARLSLRKMLENHRELFL